MQHEKFIPPQIPEQLPENRPSRSFFQSLGKRIQALFPAKKSSSSQTPLGSNFVSSANLESSPTTPIIPPPTREHDPENYADRELVREMEDYRRRKAESVKGERAQEFAEQSFNATLTPLSELEAAAQARIEGIAETQLEYQDQSIPVFTLTGYPIKFLQHVVDYKLVDGNRPDITIGYQTAQRLVTDPSLWLRPQSQTNSDLPASARDGNTISCSYIDSSSNLSRGGVKSQRGITYGFSSLRPTSLLLTHIGDAGTSNQAGNLRPSQTNLTHTPQNLAQQSTHHYNEVLVKRYDDSGNPTPPDFLITYDHHITDDTKHHAAFFNVPIIDIQTQPYLDQQRQEIARRVKSIGPHSEYHDIFAAFCAFDQSSLSFGSPWKEDIFDSYGDHADRFYSDLLRALPPDIQPKFRTLIEDIEPAKRLKLLDTELTKTNQHLAQSQNTGTYFTSPFFIRRTTRHNYHIADDSPNPYLDSVTIQYNYPLPNHRAYPLNTIIDSSSPVYPYFSQLIDQYQSNGGHVVDDRLKNSE